MRGLASRGGCEPAQQYFGDIQGVLSIHFSLSGIPCAALRKQGLKKLAGDAKFDVCGHW